MTEEELKNFHSQDKKIYQIDRNKDFLLWLQYKVYDGYKVKLKNPEMQELVNNIANWYELKYPEKNYNDDLKEFTNLNNLSNEMTIDELIYRLPENQVNLLNSKNEIDVELKEKLLELSTFKLVYSKNTTPLTGYIRATKLVDEFNNYYNIDVQLDRCDELFIKDYKNEKDTPIKKLLNKYFN